MDPRLKRQQQQHAPKQEPTVSSAPVQTKQELIQKPVQEKRQEKPRPVEPTGPLKRNKFLQEPEADGF